ncbi:hypothetical protein M0811_09926 [Anaeramoeba ignava]|uniref:Uncharacterized protein n=1 Tax=Anaeramoeba ignava TaxID=1746090 RepID=A0A9Q0LEH5_ANAIG|nr:hypothetical protein M0811_09926 [Anaeramoeba ignava]
MNYSILLFSFLFFFCFSQSEKQFNISKYEDFLFKGSWIKSNSNSEINIYLTRETGNAFLHFNNSNFTAEPFIVRGYLTLEDGTYLDDPKHFLFFVGEYDTITKKIHGPALSLP